MNTLQDLKTAIDKIAKEIAPDFEFEYILEEKMVKAVVKIKVGGEDVKARSKFYLEELRDYYKQTEFIQQNISIMVDYLRDEKELTGPQRGDVKNKVEEIGEEYSLRPEEKAMLRKELVHSAARMNRDKKLNNLMTKK